MKFHDGTPFTAVDVVFSIERAQQPTSQIAQFIRRLGKPVRIDDYTVELRLDIPNPILLENMASLMIMSRAWAMKHGVERVPDFTAKEEAHSTRHAIGTGPFMLKERHPGVRTVLVRNPNWWQRFEGNVQEVVFTPIENDATRTSALLSGGIDLTHNAPPADVERLSKDSTIRITRGPENRVIFLGFDQHRDELQYASVKGRNPFKDVRVREALLRAIDVHTLRATIMRGESVPTSCMTTAAIGCTAPELEVHPPPDLDRARKLMADAGYADGFELTLDCPNDRYINDQAMCVAFVGMLAKIGVRLKVDARPKTLYFPKIQKYDTSFFLLGWGGGSVDAQVVFDPLLRTFDPKTQKGGDNLGRFSDPELDALIDSAGAEMDFGKREKLIAEALRRVAQRHYVLPLHRQMLTWASRAQVHPVLMPSNNVRVDWIRMDGAPGTQAAHR